MGMCTLLYLKWIANKDLSYSTGNSALCYVAAWMGGVGRMDTCICMAESLCCPPETITTLLISYTPTQNKNLKKKKRIQLFWSKFRTSRSGYWALAWENGFQLCLHVNPLVSSVLGAHLPASPHLLHFLTLKENLHREAHTS